LIDFRPAKMANADYSGDEILFLLLLFAAAVTLAGATGWYRPIFLTRARGAALNRLLLALLPPLLLAALLHVLRRWADPKTVVGHWDYIVLFLLGGAAWLAAAAGIGRALGVSARDDAIERANPAAAIAVGGALAGSMSIYAWCNVGAGPTIWTTIWPACVATAAWAALWLVVEVTTHGSDAVAIDRDAASALRLAAWLVGSGWILGRAMAGDWTSWGDSFGGFVRTGWIAGVLAVVMILLQRMLRPTPARPRPSVLAAGVMPAMVLALLALVYVAILPRPEIGVHIISYEQYTGERGGE